MPKNVGGLDRTIRFAAGGLLMALGIAQRGRGRLMLLGGLGLIFSAYAQYCPVNKALGANTLDLPEPRLASDQSVIQETSEESFPASDAPAWTMGNPS